MTVDEQIATGGGVVVDTISKEEVLEQAKADVKKEKLGLIPKTVKRLRKWKIFATTKDNETLFVYNSDKGVFEGGEDAIVKGKIQEFIKGGTRNNLVVEIINTIKRETYMNRNDFEANKEWINVKNGMLNLRTRELVKHDPGFLSLKQIPVVYDPDADCPVLKKFLSEVVSVEDARDIMRFWGYTLAPHCKYDKAIVFVGVGSNGKSVLLTTVTKFFGLENTSNESLKTLCDNKFRDAELFGKIANIKSELSAVSPVHSENFKALVSGLDTITGEKKNKDPFKFRNVAKIWCSCNQLPNVDFNDIAWYRRWITILFPRKFVACVDANVNLDAELTTESEKSGALNMALQGYKELETAGGFANWNDTDKVRRLYVAYAGNSVARFGIEKLVFNAASQDTILKEDLYRAYEQYHEVQSRNSIVKEPVRAYDTFYRDLEVLFGIKERECRISGGSDDRQRALKGVVVVK